RRGGPVDFLMAWVSVSDLAVHRSCQRYTSLRHEPHARIVRFEGLDALFATGIGFDNSGVVLDYPDIARCVTWGETAPRSKLLSRAGRETRTAGPAKECDSGTPRACPIIQRTPPDTENYLQAVARAGARRRLRIRSCGVGRLVVPTLLQRARFRQV